MLKVENIGISFGGVSALSNISFQYDGSGILSIIGPNGAGKTTLFNIITSLYRPDTGQVVFLGKKLIGLKSFIIARSGLSRTFQQAQIFTELNILENIMVGFHSLNKSTIFEEVFTLPRSRINERASMERALKILDFLGFDDPYAAADILPYGKQRLLEIGRVLATEPKLILFDEPAAGLNLRETEELSGIIRNISGQGIGVVLVEHDMNLVMNVSEHIIVLNYGKLIAAGSADEVRNNKAVIEAYLGG